MVTTREEIATRLTAALLANPALDRQPDDRTIADAIYLADLMIARLAATAPTDASADRPSDVDLRAQLKANSTLTLNAYQAAALQSAVYPGVGRKSLTAVSYVIHGLTGEAGEIANKFKKVLRGDAGTTCVTPEVQEALMAEVGDVLWYIAALSAELGFDLDAVATANIDKIRSRQARGALTGSGDNR